MFLNIFTFWAIFFTEDRNQTSFVLTVFSFLNMHHGLCFARFPAVICLVNVYRIWECLFCLGLTCTRRLKLLKSIEMIYSHKIS